jgi:hypothetical protein
MFRPRNGWGTNAVPEGVGFFRCMRAIDIALVKELLKRGVFPDPSGV